MIDLHNHILYGLDDGPETIEESLDMCRMGYGDGIHTIVATPHMLNGVYQNSRAVILSRVQELNHALASFPATGHFRSPGTQAPDGVPSSCPSIRNPESEIRNSESSLGSSIRNPQSEIRNSQSPLVILPGADVHLDSELLQELKQDRLVTLGDGGRFLLIEFPSQGIPFQAEQILFQLMAMRIKPIITHPERNLEVRRRPERYADMIRSGCLGQVTGMSLTGDFGPEVKQLAEKMLLHRLVHVIATDSHSTDGRPPILSKAVKAASKILGRKEAYRMVTEYPRAILEGRKPGTAPPVPL
ncbi:MAG: hypothetical protein EHM36_09310 [Deltaproteobacteria bacterium]|nr:MAG: hypothetical protein EHM36_09310 [Deltaproteobacteria bacterium]